MGRLPKITPAMHPQIIQMAAEGATNEQIATLLGCTVRTLDRHRAGDQVLNARIISARNRWNEAHRPACGTAGQYSYGCRLTPCRQAHTRYCAAYQARKRAGEEMADPPAAAGRHSDVGGQAQRGTCVVTGLPLRRWSAQGKDSA